MSAPEDVDVWIGLDVGKHEHFADVLDAAGRSFYTAATNGATTTLTFHGKRNFLSCFEYRVNGSLPTVAGANPNTNLPDGRWAFRCVAANATATSSVDITDADLIEVRLAFGAESNERFNWEIVS